MAMPPERHEAMATLRAAFDRLALPGLVAAYAFGSVVEGRSHDQSDLDVGVLFDRAAVPSTRARFEAQLDLRRQLSPGVVGRELDVVVLNDVSPLFGRQIVGAGVQVYCGTPPLDQAFRRDVQLRAADLEPFINRMRRLTVDALSR